MLAWQGGGLPADEQAALARYPAQFAATPLLPPLRYQRLSITRVRIGIDAYGPLSAFTLPRLLPALAKLSLDGLPAARAPFARRPWSMELHCSAMPAPSAAQLPPASATGR